MGRSFSPFSLKGEGEKDKKGSFFPSCPYVRRLQHGYCGHCWWSLERWIEWQILRCNSQASVFTMTECSEARESKWHAAEKTINNQQHQWTLALKQYSCVLFEVPMNFEVLENCQYYPNKVCIRPSVLLGGAIIIIFCFSGCQTPICFKVFWSTTWKIRSVTKIYSCIKNKPFRPSWGPQGQQKLFLGHSHHPSYPILVNGYKLSGFPT